MPARDVYHDTVINALVKDGWRITDDPLILSFGNKDVYVDLGAEYPIGAEKDSTRIAVEIKSFLGASDVRDLEIALGQYNLYRDVLFEVEPERRLYLAIPVRVYTGIFSDPLGQLVIKRQNLNLFVFDESEESIARWIP
jgi:hypothetical protein